MTKKWTKAGLEALGYKFADADHPIYTDGPLILFGNRIAPPPSGPESVDDADTTEEEDSNG